MKSEQKEERRGFKNDSYELGAKCAATIQPLPLHRCPWTIDKTSLALPAP